MFSQYEKEFGYGTFWKSYEELHYLSFWDNIFGLGGFFSELMRGRRYLLGYSKEDDKEFKKWARENCSTPEIDLWRQENFKNQDFKRFTNSLSTLGGQYERNRERRLKERKQRGGR